MIPLSYNVRSLTVRKATTAAAMLGIALVVFVFSAVLMLQNGIKKTLGKSGRSDNVIVLRKGSDAELASGIEEQQQQMLLADADVVKDDQGPLGVEEIAVVVTLNKIGTNGGISNVQIRGVPWDAKTPAAPGLLRFRPEVKLIHGRAPANDTECVVGKELLGRFDGTNVGGKLLLKKGHDVSIVGAFEADGSSFESEVWCSKSEISQTFNRGGVVSSVRLRLAAASKFDGFKTRIESDKTLGLDVERESDYYAKLSEGTSTFLTALGLVIAIFFSFGAMIGASITMYASVANRSKEIGTLRALGFSRLSIMTSFVLEALILALGGGAIGALASMLMAFVRFSTMNFASWSEIVFTFDPKPGIIIGSMMFASFMGLIGGFFPALRASRVSPIEAMRG
jgi:putative ABC transport system permease protein